MKAGQPVSNARHNHFGWYLAWDFDEEYVKKRSIPKRNEYIELMEIYNPYLKQDIDRWWKIRWNMIHIKQYGIDINHRHR